jgi:DNA-binding CsgD family transcriptional regulator/tetratricopeptide (TPR) repeat protein
MTTGGTRRKARAAFERRAWRDAYSAYAGLAEEGPLSLDDLEQYAAAAHLLGEEPASREALTHVYREALQLNDAGRAARAACWLAHSMIFSGETAQANAWNERARALLTERGADCAEWGYVMILPGIEQVGSGDAAAARCTFEEAQAIGRRFADTDLVAMAGHGLGRALIRLGLRGEAMSALDQVMLEVTAGEVGPFVVGRVYCGVLEACQEVFDMRRAREWTAALTRWCEGQQDLVPYRGPCLVHRVEVMRLRGDWEDAIEEARRACDWLSSPVSPEGPADAFYQLGELHRLRGDFAKAEDAYRQANRLGRPPEPGLALLWLASGRADSATTAVRRALDAAGDDPVKRSELLAAHVEIMLALDDAAGAEEAAGELDSLASTLEALPLRALADRARASVLIAGGDARAALSPLRRSWTAYKELDAPYEAARVRAMIGKACLALGDEESAAMEFDAARWVFERLGASPDLALIDAVSTPFKSPVEGLTSREIEVLSLIAAGETNKAIAATLVISEHTVARHVQNMLQKLGYSSRASLAAFAVERGLTRTPPGQN